MKLEAVDAWLRHWQKIQKKNKRPLIFKDPSGKTSEQRPNPKVSTAVPNPTAVSKGKRKGKAKNTGSDHSGYKSTSDERNNDVTNAAAAEPNPNRTGPSNGSTSTAITMPPSPLSALETRKTRRAFLESLSNDKNYRKLVLLLDAADVSVILAQLEEADRFPEWRSFRANSTGMGNMENKRQLSP